MARPKTNHEEKKARIIQAAMAVFAHHGYEGTTNKLIAAEVRRRTSKHETFSPALIYHYFPDGKPQLLATVMQQYQPLQALGQTVRDTSDAPPDVFLRTVARNYVRLFREPETPLLLRILLAEGPRHPELTRRVAGQMFQILVIPMVAYLQRQVNLGRLHAVPPLAAIFQFFGPLMIRGLLMENLKAVTPPFPMPDDETMIEHHVRAFLHGLATDTARGAQGGAGEHGGVDEHEEDRR
jgi:AcrR family transcriptional regulator